MTDNNTFLAVFLADLITQQQKQLIMFVKFHVRYSGSCFLSELPGDNYKSTLNIKFEQDWSFTLGATLGGRQKIEKHYSSYKDFFPGKADSAILLGFECTIDPQNLMQIVGAIFEKMKI